MTAVRQGFQAEVVAIPITKILLSQKPDEKLEASHKFRQILASVQEIGLIEPLSISSASAKSDVYVLLDGNIRLLVLKKMGYAEAPCLIANDDEAYTYNARVNRLSTVQEHFMVRRAIERGVSKDRLAKALSIDVRNLDKKISLLDGICAEAANLLKDRQFAADITRILRKMKPTRQVECVELMVSANTITTPYAEALLVATPAAMLIEGKKSEKLQGLSQEQMFRMEREMASLQGQYKMVEETYGQDILNLVLARGYLSKILENKAVARHLKQKYPEFVEQFETIIATTSLDR